MNQKTLVLIKPDARDRGLSGEIIKRIENVGLKIVKSTVKNVTPELADQHYPVTDEWLTKVGNNTLTDCEKYGVDVVETMGTDDPKKIGEMVHDWNIDYLMSAPILALVFEGPHAVEIVRKLCGPTLPLLAAPGTIRGDFSSVSALSENAIKSPIRNLVHASGSPEEADREIELWFGKE
jgi:nucleoside-diphosphate kinase